MCRYFAITISQVEEGDVTSPMKSGGKEYLKFLDFDFHSEKLKVGYRDFIFPVLAFFSYRLEFNETESCWLNAGKHLECAEEN